MSDSLPVYRTEHGAEFEAIVTPDGVPRFLARTPPPPGKPKAPAFGSTVPLIDPKDWRGLVFARHRPDVPILNQGPYGSCNPHACVTGLMRARASDGQAFALLSPCFLYAQINGGSDAGSNIGEGFDALEKVGTCLETQAPEGRIFQRQYAPAQWADAIETAGRFRIESGERYSASSFEEIVTAAILGYHFVLSVFVAGNWNSLDRYGRPPAYRGWGNHAVAGGDGLFFTDEGEPLLDMTNSWGKAWGLGGRFRLGRSHIEGQAGFECEVMRASTSDPRDSGMPPIGR